jgi:hypothetical protein
MLCSSLHARAQAAGAKRLAVSSLRRDERQQVELLGRLTGEGLECRALLS